MSEPSTRKTFTGDAAEVMNDLKAQLAAANARADGAEATLGDEAVRNIRLGAERDALQAELHRWQHGAQVEGDYVCASDAENQHWRDEVDRLKAELAEVDQARAQYKAACYEAMTERDALRALVVELADELGGLAAVHDHDHYAELIARARKAVDL